MHGLVHTYGKAELPRADARRPSYCANKRYFAQVMAGLSADAKAGLFFLVR